MDRREIAAKVVEKFKSTIEENATLRAEVKNFETVLTETRSGLLKAPINGEPWDKTLNYVNETCTDGGVTYKSLRYNKDKRPSENPDFWEVVPDTAPVTAWSDIADGSVITEGTVVSQDGKIWVCISQHFKSTVYKPKAGSSKWEEKVNEKEVRKLS